MQRNALTDANERMMAELEEITDERNQIHRRSVDIANQLLNSTEDLATRPLDAEFDEMVNREQRGSLCLYRRNTASEMTWDDFELISIIGRGTFGKVYLVRNKRQDKFYAMKVIRKDVVI